MPSSSSSNNNNNNHLRMGACKGESIRSLRRRLSNGGSTTTATSASLLADIEEAGKQLHTVTITDAASEEASSGESSVENEPQQPERPQDDDHHLVEEELQHNKQQADAVRLRLLSKLGIPPPPGSGGNHNHSSHGVPTNHRVSSRPKEASYQVPLNDIHNNSGRQKKDRRLPLAFAPRSDGGGDPPTSSPTTTLNFHPIVTVHPIPSHGAYSQRIRRTVWTSARELHAQVERNCLEFAAEGWTAEGVLDEDALVRTADGTLVHPVHFPSPDEDDDDDENGFVPLKKEASINP